MDTEKKAYEEWLEIAKYEYPHNPNGNGDCERACGHDADCPLMTFEEWKDSL